MQKKPRVLMELRPIFQGFSGIPQETRLLFASFLNLTNIEVFGLLNGNTACNTKRGLKTTPSHVAKPEHQKIYQLSRFINSHYTYSFSPSSSHASSSSPALLSSVLSILNVALKSITSSLNLTWSALLGLSVPIDHFETEGFRDFLWEKLFSKTLTLDDFEKVTNASYRTLYASWAIMHALSYTGLHLKLNTTGYDAFFSQMPFPAQMGKETQLIVRYHDAIPLFLPHKIPKPRMHSYAHYTALCSNAKKAIFACTSNSSRADLLRLFPQLENRSVVIHDVISPGYFEKSSLMKEHISTIFQTRLCEKTTPQLLNDIPKEFKYILMVSTIEIRKNHVRLIRAWEMLRMKLNLNIKLIFVGELGWQYQDILAAMKPWQKRKELLHLHKVPLEELRLLYQEAECVVCPSVAEGFDLSGAEAMSCKTVVVASDIPVHREVYGDAAIYFHPYCPSELAMALESVLRIENEPRIEQLQKQGFEQAQRYHPKEIEHQWENFFNERLVKNNR